MKDHMLFTDTACLAILYRLPTLLLPSRLWLVFCANLVYAICSLARQVCADAACPILKASDCDRSVWRLLLLQPPATRIRHALLCLCHFLTCLRLRESNAA